MSTTTTASSSSTASESRNWLELPDEVTAKILQKLSLIDILVYAQIVCRSWWRICQDSSMWRRIDMADSISNDSWLSSSRTSESGNMTSNNLYLDMIFRRAVDLSDGQLIDINFQFHGFDDVNRLLQYIAERSSGLKRLRLVPIHGYITNEGLIEAAPKLPLLEDLELINHRYFSKEALTAIGKSCPLLKSLKLNRQSYESLDDTCDDQALAIAETMPGLRHLELVSNSLSLHGLRAILRACPHLEYFDLLHCFNLPGPAYLRKILVHQVKSLKLPGSEWGL